MKFSLALVASTVLAAQTLKFVTVDRTLHNNDQSCIKIPSMNVPSTSDFSVAPAIKKSFEGFGLRKDKNNKNIENFTSVNVVVNEKATGKGVSYKITVTVKGNNWADASHVEYARARAVLQIAGTLNLFHAMTDPWTADIQFKTNAKFDVDSTSETYSRDSIASIKRMALTKGCKGFPE